MLKLGAAGIFSSMPPQSQVDFMKPARGSVASFQLDTVTSLTVPQLSQR